MAGLGWPCATPGGLWAWRTATPSGRGVPPLWEWPSHPLAPIFLFSFFFDFFFKKISIFIYFLINLYYFINIGHVSAMCHQ